MSKSTSSVRRKRQVAIPAKPRELLGVEPRDRVAFEADGESVRITRVGSRLAAGYQSVLALSPSRSVKEMTDLAWEEHAQAAAREGMLPEPQRS